MTPTMKQIIAGIILTLVTLTGTVRPIFAVNLPNFPSCINPSGTVIAQYDTGTHGIAGSSGTYTGADTVYNTGAGTIVQCFCSSDGNGIQTDWWNASSLTQEEVEILKSQGWHYIPDGNLWGLSAEPYIAKNSTYSCLPTGGGNPNGGGDGRSDGRSSCPECTAPPTGGGDILGASTGDILGLAATGDSWILYSVFAAALFLLVAGVRKLRNA